MKARALKFGKTGYDSPIVEVAVALASQQDGNWHVSGTAVAIAQNILLTSKHVIEHHWGEFEVDELRSSSTEGHFNLFARQYHSTPNVGVIWTVREFWPLESSDFALLRVESGAPEVVDYLWPSVVMQLVPPEVGDSISAFGYRESTIEISEIDIGKSTVTWNETPTTSKGSVTLVYDNHRDSVMLSFPCFETDARFDPGMSGGPVFSESGELMGLICSGLEDLESNTYVSYVGSLWPLMGLQIKAKLKGDRDKKSYTIMELTNRGIFHAKNTDRVTVSRDGDMIHTKLLKSRSC